jgi:hypothetical protein
MPPFSGDFIQTVVAPQQSTTLREPMLAMVPLPIPVFFNLELTEEVSDNTPLDWNMFTHWDEVRTIKHGKSYLLEITASANSTINDHFKQQHLNIKSAIDLQIGCTETKVRLENDIYKEVSPEDVFTLKKTVRVIVPDECPTKECISFVLLCREANSRLRPVAQLDVKLDGTYHPADESLIEKAKVELDASLPGQTAILHIVASNVDKLTIKGWSPYCEKLQADLVSWAPIKLGEFIERGISPESIINHLRRFSRSQIGDLILWLKPLLKRYSKDLCLVIVDHTDMETPWEMIELEDTEYLGAHAKVVRWTRIRCFGAWHTLKMQDMQKQGTIIAYLDDEELGAQQTYHEREALKTLKSIGCRELKELKQQLRRLEPQHDVGLIYLGCHGYEGMAIGSLHSHAERITYLDLEIPKVYPDPRPIVFVNACESARLKRDGKDYFSGLLEVLLARFASGYIGTLGRVGSTYASTVAERLLKEACMHPNGIQIPEVLRQLRAEAVKEITDDQLEALSEQEKQKREERFLYAFLYVYYGNALVRLQLLQAEETEDDHDSQ